MNPIRKGNLWLATYGEGIVIFDIETGRKYAFNDKGTINITPDKKKTPLLLVTGSRQYIEEQQSKYLPAKAELLPNYPNPFNPTTTLRFTLPDQAIVLLQVYDILGRKVQTLIDEVRQAGVHKVTFDASRWSSGVYFAVFELSGQRFVQKMTLIK